ncbi:MAG: hypothetical protein ACTSP4_03205 [Candidatus Hodarchaeales archaeon]
MNNEKISKLKSFKPESAPDLINPQPKVLIFGYGWVGNYINRYFTEADIYSKEFGLYLHSSNEFIDEELLNSFIRNKRWEMGIICVPTPSLESGKCDLSEIDTVISYWKEHIDIFLLKSTVEVGTTVKLMEKYRVRIVFSPEYIGETIHHSLTKFNPETFIILGGTPEDTHAIAQFYKTVLNANAILRQVDSNTAELCKYMENAFLATKVIFCNEFYDIARALNIDYDELREIWLLDPRVTRSHTFVYENNRGFSGKCLPKDIKALIAKADEKGIKIPLMEFILKRNDQYRSK